MNCFVDVATSGVEERPSRPWRCRIPSWRKPTEEVLGSSKSSASLVEVLVESSQSSYETPIVRIVTRDVAVDVRHPHHLPPPPPLESASSPSSLSKDLRFFVLDISLSLPFRPQLSPLAIPPMIHLAYLQHRSIAGVDSLESRTPRPSSPFTPPPNGSNEREIPEWRGAAGDSAAALPAHLALTSVGHRRGGRASCAYRPVGAPHRRDRGKRPPRGLGLTLAPPRRGRSSPRRFYSSRRSGLPPRRSRGIVPPFSRKK